jgi:hypothetical protein
VVTLLAYTGGEQGFAFNFDAALPLGGSVEDGSLPTTPILGKSAQKEKKRKAAAEAAAAAGA